MFALFISSQNYEELKGLYCRMMYVQLGLDEELLQQLNNSLVSNVLNTLKQVNYKYIWYADTQASLSVVAERVNVDQRTRSEHPVEGERVSTRVVAHSRQTVPRMMI